MWESIFKFWELDVILAAYSRPEMTKSWIVFLRVISIQSRRASQVLLTDKAQRQMWELILKYLRAKEEQKPADIQVIMNYLTLNA